MEAVNEAVGLEWNPVALPGILALAAGWTMAAFVYFAAPTRPQNRILALVLVFEGTAWGSGAGVLYVMGDRAPAFGVQALFYLSLLVLPGLYLLFLGTLDSPLAVPLRNRWARASIAALTTLAPALYFVDRSGWTTDMVPTWYAAWEAVLGPNFAAWFPVYGVVALFGLAVAISAVLRARPGTLARRQMKWFAVAFGIRDGITAFLFLAAPLFLPLPPSGSWTDLVYLWGGPLGTLAFTPIMAYAILKHHLFDIDVRIRWTIRQGTVATVFLGVLILVGQVAQNLLGDVLGWGLGGLAAAALLFALAPLQRLAERVASATMPRATGTTEYFAFKKLEVYQAALEGAWRDDSITDRERTTLARLRAKLGISPSDAARLEHDVRAVLGAG